MKKENEAPRIYTLDIFKDGGAKSAEAEEYSLLPLQKGSSAKVDKGIIYLILASICYTLMSILIRLLDKEIPIFSQIFLRYIVAATAVFTFAKITKTNLRLKNTKDYLIMFFIAIFGYAFSTIFFTLAILTTTISNAVFIFSIYVVITPILGFLFLHERISKFAVFAIVFAFTGLYFLFNPTNINNSLGGLFALVSAIFQASYLIGGRKLKGYPAKTLLVYSTICGVISLGIISFIIERNFYFPPSTLNQSIYTLSPFIWMVILIFGLDNFFAWLFLNKGLQTVKAGTSSVILLIEPVLATLLGIIFYNEIPQLTSILGILIISTGILLATKERNDN